MTKKKKTIKKTIKKKSKKLKGDRKGICRDHVRVNLEKEQESKTSDSETGEEEAENCRGRDRIEQRGSRNSKEKRPTLWKRLCMLLACLLGALALGNSFDCLARDRAMEIAKGSLGSNTVGRNITVGKLGQEFGSERWKGTRSGLVRPITVNLGLGTAGSGAIQGAGVGRTHKLVLVQQVRPTIEGKSKQGELQVSGTIPVPASRRGGLIPSQ